MISGDSSSSSTAPARRSVGQAYVLFVVSLLLVVTLGAAAQLASLTVGLIVTEVLLILGPAVVFVRRKGLPVAQALGWRPIAWGDGLLAVAVGVTSWGAAAGMVVLCEPLLGPPPEVPGLVPHSVPQLLWILFCGAVLPGICEETLLRGAIQGLLWRRGGRWAVLVTAVLFAAFHVNPWILLPLLLLGVVFGTLAARTGSVLPAVLAHFAANATSSTMSYLFHADPDPTAAYVPLAWLAAGCVVVLPLAWQHTRGRDPAPPILAAVPAAVGRVLPWVLGLAGAAVALLLVALLVAGLALVGVQTVPDDDLAPLYQRGDHLVLFKAGTLPLDLEVGDVVAFDVDGEEVLGTLTEVGEEEVQVRHAGSEHRLPRERVKAKVVHVVGDLGGDDG